MKKASFLLLALLVLGIAFYSSRESSIYKKVVPEITEKPIQYQLFPSPEKKVLVKQFEKKTDVKEVKQTIDARILYEQFLSRHEYNNRARKDTLKYTTGNNFETAEATGDNPDLAFEQDYLRTMDPALKRPTPELLPDIMVNNAVKLVTGALMGLPGSGTHTSWSQRGPSNVGGRTRAIAWDPNDLTGKKVWAGGVTGGLWYNNDITNINSSWVNVGDLWANLSITQIAFDPNNPQIIYVSTGEGYQVGSSRGAGIWKSTDGGTTWLQLESTKLMTYINDIVVRNEGGSSVVYAAIDGNSYEGSWSIYQNTGLYRSTDGGTSWAQVLPINANPPGTGKPFTPSSISIADDNRIWIGTKSSPYNGSDRGGGKILYSDNGVDWTIAKSVAVTNGHGRVTVVTAPSNANYIYAFIEKNTDNTGSTIELIKSTDKGLNWSNMTLPNDEDDGIAATDFSRGQAWYDQVLKVDPNNPQTVYVGAIDLFKSTNEGSTWTQISKWSDNPGMGSIARLSYVHADQHAMVFKPGSSSTAIFGNDGGVFYSANLTNASISAVIQQRNNQYNVTQFYAAAMHPNSSTNYYIAGAQDNGTQLFNAPGLATTSELTGGDGAYCFIDQNNPNYIITSYVYNYVFRSTDGGANFTDLIYDGLTGSFINPACYDNNLHIYYSYKSSDGTNGTLYKVTGITSTPVTSSITITGLSSDATAFKISPYTTSATTMFIGTSSGKIFKVTNANTTPVVTNITGTSFPTGSISSIDLGANENQLLVTFFNYGVNKIWYSNDGGTTWLNKMGDFPNIPARWGMFNPKNRSNDVVLATELGIFGTTNFSTSTPTWTQLNNGFANVRTDMLQYRSSDDQVIAATHGRGLYSSMGFVVAPTITSFTPTKASTGTTITISGGNFSGTTSVSFGGVAASTFTVTSDNTITAVVGSGASGNVAVVNPGGQAISPGFTFCVNSTANLSSGINSNNQTVCQNTSINPITYATNNISSLSVIGLPAGLTADITSNQVTITGTPTIAGSFNYTLTLSGGCQSIITTGTITVTASNTISLTSPNGSNEQTICVNTSLANITYSTTGATGAIVTGLPVGVTSAWVANVLTIAGTPITSGVFTYTINLTGGCSSATTIGTIKIDGESIAGNATASSTEICVGKNTSITLLENTGSVIWQSSVNGIDSWIEATGGTGSKTNSYTTPNLSTKIFYRASVKNGVCVAKLTNVLTINTIDIPAAPVVTNQNICKDTILVTLTATPSVGNKLIWYGSNETGGSGVSSSPIINTAVIGSYNYYVSQSNSIGCEGPRAKLAVKISGYPALPTIKRDTTNNLVSSNFFGNQWYKDQVLLSDTSQIIKPVAAGYYTVKTIVDNCASSLSDPYYYVNLVTDIFNIEKNEFIKLYPNPILNDLKIDFYLNKFQKVNISIYNTTTGNKVIYLVDRLSGINIDVRNLPSGTYVVLVSSSSNQIIYKQKLIKF